MLPQDVQNLIFSDIKHGQTFKAVIRLNHWSYITYKSRKSAFMNQLLTLVKRYPDKDWSWYHILSNPSTPAWYIEELIKEWKWISTSKYYYDNVNGVIDAINGIINVVYIIYTLYSGFGSYDPNKWNWCGISSNPNITPDIIERHPTILWSWKDISRNPNINIRFVKDNLDKPWDWGYLTINKGISPIDIEENPDLPWDFKIILLNPNIIKHNSLNPSNLMNLLLKYNEVDTITLSSNSNITEEFIEARLNYPWDWDVLSGNPNIGAKFIKEHPNYDWDYYRISRRIPLDDMMRYLSAYIDYDGLTHNPTLTDEFVKNHSWFEWDYNHLCANEGLSFEFLKTSVPGIYWKKVSWNPRITIDYIEANIDKNWNWSAISECEFNHT